MKKVDALVCGTIFTDIIFSSIPRMPNPGEEVFCEGFEFTCGGSAYITSVAMARLGMEVAVLSSLGNDFLSQFIKASLEKEGIATHLIQQVERPLRNVSAAINHGGDRAFLSYSDKNDILLYQNHILDALDTVNATYLLINPVLESIPIIEKAKKKGMQIVFDLGWDDQWIFDPRLKEVIKMGHIFSPNLLEATSITGKKTVDEALEELKDWIDTVMIKIGPDGTMFNQEGVNRVVPSRSVQAIDTTGAGDNFIAGVLMGLSRGWNLEKSIRLGNYCGSESVKGLGGTAASPTWDQVIREFEI